MMQTSLPAIRTLARSGATDLAWAAFHEAGWHERTDQPGALCLMGRLLKDKGAQAASGERQACLDRAIAAYLAAFDLSPATYPLINAATLACLSGDDERARSLAQQTLALLDSGAHEPETAYWLAATRAEAELLLGNLQRAENLLRRAVQIAPEAWEDHASTLVQFSRIAVHRGLSTGWLERIRPPASLSYRGMMGLSARDDTATAKIEGVLERERPGFLYGALAAGADILIAEAGLRRGARLHVLLPSPVADFRAASVAPFGAGWAARFDTLCATADTIETIEVHGHPSVAGVMLAQAMARGLAVANARELQSTAFALHVSNAPAETDTDTRSWTESDLRTIPISCPQTARSGFSPLADDQTLFALVACPDQSTASEPDSEDGSWHTRSGGCRIAAYPGLRAAIGAARKLAGRHDNALAIGLDCVLVPRGAHPDLNAISGASAIARAARPGQWLASRAMALSAIGQSTGTLIQPIGELRRAAGRVELYAVTPP